MLLPTARAPQSQERDELGRPLAFLTRKEARELKAKREEEKWQNIREADEMARSFREAADMAAEADNA